MAQKVERKKAICYTYTIYIAIQFMFRKNSEACLKGAIKSDTSLV